MGLIQVNADVPEAFLPLLTPKRHKGAYGGRGGAKCLGRGTKVVMLDGSLMAVEHIQVGDRLLGVDGSARNVLSLAHGSEELYRVTQSSAQSYVANGAHILALEQSESSLSDGRYPKMEPARMSVQDYLASSNRFKSQFFGYKRAASFAWSEQPIDPYFLGAWLGDGDSSRPAITTADNEIVEYLSTLAASFDCRITKFGKPNNLASGYLIARKNGSAQENPITGILRNLGVIHNKHIPHKYLVSSEDQRLSLLAGLIDTDGSIHNNCYVISQSRQPLASQIKFVADSLGFKTYLRPITADCAGVPCAAWKLSICGDVWRIPCKIARKRLAQADMSKNKDWRRSRVDITSIGEGEYFGFELDGDHLFFLEDFTVTHNSHFFAEQLVLRCFARETRAACIREVQNTLKESVRQLIVDKIKKFGLEEYFDVLESEIRGKKNGSLIIFRGMQSFNAESIKSLEGFDIAWVEEAQTLSGRSLRLLRPTIRKEGSEIWYSWNPRFDSDAVDAFFRGGSISPDAVSVRVNWSDNPWFPDVLRREREHDHATDAEMAEHVWEGGYEIITEGAYYARLLAAAQNEGRIGDFPFKPGIQLRTSWDIGVDDYTAIWFIQDDGLIPTVVDYYEASGDGAPEIVKDCMPELLPELADQLLGLNRIERDHPFKYTRHFLPHDVKVREWGAGAKERVLTLMELGVKPIHVGVADKDDDRINASRQLIPITRFNNTKRVQVGLGRLRRFSRRFNETMGTYSGALHDINSHAADSFGEYAVNCDLLPKPIPIEKPKKVLAVGEGNEVTFDDLMPKRGRRR